METQTCGENCNIVTTYAFESFSTVSLRICTINWLIDKYATVSISIRFVKNIRISKATFWRRTNPRNQIALSIVLDLI